MTGTMHVMWEGLDADALAKRCGVPRVDLFAETASTQDVAHLRGEEGAPAGTVVLADAQSSGRGRMGRSWRSEPGLGVWCTILERPHSSALNVLSLRVGLHCAEALDPFADARVGLKWPNDLVGQIPRYARDDDHPVSPRSEATRDLQFGKLGGILVEARWTGECLAWVALGVGVNVTTPDVKGAAGLRAGADRLSVLVALVRATRSAAADPGPLTSDELTRFQARDVLAGRRIVFPAHGTVQGITAAGSLIVTTNRGVEEVRSGTVHLADE